MKPTIPAKAAVAAIFGGIMLALQAQDPRTWNVAGNPEGDVYFVTVTEPAQSVLSWFVGRDEPAIQFLTSEEKFGLQTPQQLFTGRGAAG